MHLRSKVSLSHSLGFIWMTDFSRYALASAVLINEDPEQGSPTPATRLLNKAISARQGLGCGVCLIGFDTIPSHLHPGSLLLEPKRVL